MIKSQIIKLDASYLNQIHEILLEAFGTEAWTNEQILDSLKNESIAFYGLIESNGLISILSVLQSADDINILDIATRNEFKNKGCASKLIDYLKLIKLDNQTISLEVKKSNINAINFYKKHGFKIVSERKKYYRDGEDAYVMFFSTNHES